MDEKERKEFLKTVELSLEEKISFTQDYQRTFNHWKSNYPIRVNEFVNNYEDNSEIIFIENEIENIENIENVLLQLEQALKDNYNEKDSFDLFDIYPQRDLYIDVRIEYTIKSKSTYKKIKKFLEQRKQEIEFSDYSNADKKLKFEKNISLKQIALKLACEGVNVNKDNANELVTKYGHTSGQKLYQEYNKVNTSKKRIADPDNTKKILENRIENFEIVIEIVIEILSREFKAKANDELELLKSHRLKY